MILFKYLIGINGSGIHDYNSYNPENFNSEDMKFIKQVVDEWVQKLEDLDDSEYSMMMKILVCSENLSIN